jgi:hypothetical protein
MQEDYKDHRIRVEWGFVAERDITPIILSLDPKARLSPGKYVENQTRYEFNIHKGDDRCYLIMSVTYDPFEAAFLENMGEIDHQEETYVFSATLSGYSNNKYIDEVMDDILKKVKWVEAKKFEPHHKQQMAMSIQTLKEIIDSEVAKMN